MSNNVIEFTPLRNLRKGLVFIDEADIFALLQRQDTLTIDFIKTAYAGISATNREDILAKIAHSKDISNSRKSMLFQAAHYVENEGKPDTISLYMLLGIYYGIGSKGGNIDFEVARLYDKFITKGGVAAKDLYHFLILEGLRSPPWAFSGNVKRKIIVTLDTHGITSATG